LKTETGEPRWRQKNDRRDAELIIGYGLRWLSVRQTEVLQGLVPKVELESLRVLGQQSLSVD
jgi:hypothetical protein